MSYVDELEREIAAGGDRPARLSDLARAVRAVADVAAQLERHRDTLIETVKFVNQLQERLLIVDALPEEAPFGALIRLRVGTVGPRATLYLGNGPGQPLSRLVPQPLPEM